MALPNLIDTTDPLDTELASLGASRIRALALAITDILGIPANTNITNAVITLVASGLQTITFQDSAADPATAGRLQRNAGLLKFFDGTSVQLLNPGNGLSQALPQYYRP